MQLHGMITTMTPDVRSYVVNNMNLMVVNPSDKEGWQGHRLAGRVTDMHLSGGPHDHSLH